MQVRETLPDWVLQEAYELLLIDLPPRELLERLRDGKVYVPEPVAGDLIRLSRSMSCANISQTPDQRTPCASGPGAAMAKNCKS